MKLAILGGAAIAAGIAAGTDGLVYAGAIWVVGGVVLRLVVGSPKDLQKSDAATATFGDVFGGRRGAGSALSILIGGASIAIGLIPVGFEADDPWRWVPVGLGALVAGVQVLAMLMFGVGSGLQELTGHVGNPTHPATLVLESVDNTGLRVNDQPRLALTLTVTPDGEPPYRVTIKQLVDHAELGSVRPGETYRGLVDLADPEAVRIEWHQRVTTNQAVDRSPRDDVAARLRRIDELLRDGLISDDEYDRARHEILDDL